MKTRCNKRKKEKITRPVACGDETVSLEELPYPAVYYPSHYGAFIAFKPDIECSHYTFCECSRPALYNYVKLLKASPLTEQAACQHTRKLVDKREFPISFALQDKSADLDEFFNSLIFQPGLCHVCNKKVPSYAYCHPMYGSRLEQNYGWYKRQDMFKRGIYQSPISGASRYITDSGDIAFFDPSSPPDFLPCISDDVPSRLGIWDKWENESTLHKIVTSIFPEFTIARRYKAHWLENLELDIFIHELKIGIEYQGIQHYKPLAHWGGEKGLERRLINDSRKRELCRGHGVQLVYFTYMDTITTEFVHKQLLQYII